MTDPRDDQFRPRPSNTDDEIDLTHPAAPSMPAPAVDPFADGNIIDAAAAPAPRQPRGVKDALVVSARLLTLVVGAAVAAIVIVAAAVVPLPSAVSEPPSVRVTPVADQQSRVCAGPLLRLGDETGAQATTASPLGDPIVTSASSDGRITSAGATSLDGAESGTRILSLSADADGEQPLFAGSQFQAVERGDFVGTAAAECTEAKDDTWLVGGATTTGRTTLLVIVNPGEVSATVDVSVFADTGVVTAPGATGIAIPAGGERVFSVAGLAPGLESPVIRVQSAGARVVATLQQMTVRTLTPGGVDFVTPAAAPSTEVIIPAIPMLDHDALEAAVTGEEFLDLNTVLRFFVPGSELAHATITMTKVTADGRDGEPVDIDVTLDPGVVTELLIGEFEEGTYSARISADVALVAGARVSTIGSTGATDFAWLPTVAAVDDEVLVAVADGDNATMYLVNPTESAAEFTMDGDDDRATVTIPAGGVRSIPVDGGSTWQLSGFDQLHIAVGFSGDGTIAAHTVSPRAAGSTPITVFP